MDEQEIKISTHMEKFHIWVKNAVFIKNENEFLKNYDFWYMFNKCSKFQNDLINILEDITSHYAVSFLYKIMLFR